MLTYQLLPERIFYICLLRSISDTLSGIDCYEFVLLWFDLRFESCYCCAIIYWCIRCYCNYCWLVEACELVKPPRCPNCC